MAYRAISCPLVQQLVRTIQDDYGLVDDLVAKYLGTPSTDTVSETPSVVQVVQAAPVFKKKSKAVVEPCTGRTAKGDPCRFKVKCDGLCGIHLRQRDQPVSEKKSGGVSTGSTVSKVPKKVKKVVPTHTHPPTEADPQCGLCENQGDVVVPELTAAEFEAVEEEGSSIQDRLRAILACADDDEDDEVPVGTTEPETPLDTMDDLLAALPTTTEPMEDDVALRVRLAKLIAEEDSDSDLEDDAIEQMSETPPSQAKLAVFQELLEEAEE